METLPKNLIACTHPSRCPVVIAGFGGLLSQNSVRAEDGTVNTRMQLDRRKVWFFTSGNRETGGKVIPERLRRQIN